MRLIRAIGFAIVISSLCISTAWAFESDKFAFFTAQVTTSGTPVEILEASLKNVSDNQSASIVSWSNIMAGTTDWKAADQYIDVKYSANQLGWGIQIYTDNTGPNANPKYVGTNDSAAGLISPDGLYRLPTCWRGADEPFVVDSGELNIAEDSETGRLCQDKDADEVPDDADPDQDGVQVYSAWLWMKDKEEDSFKEGEEYITVVNANGIQHAEMTRDGWGESPIVIYIGAKFQNATVNTKYATSTLTLELYHE